MAVVCRTTVNGGGRETVRHSCTIADEKPAMKPQFWTDSPLVRTLDGSCGQCSTDGGIPSSITAGCCARDVVHCRVPWTTVV